MKTDEVSYVLNGQAHGSVADRLMEHDWDPRALRRFIGNDGRCYQDIPNGKLDEGGRRTYVPALVTNANATLRKDEWNLLDTDVMKVAKERLSAMADLRSAGLTYTIGDGMGVSVLQTQAQGDITEARMSMDGMADSESDRLEFNLTNLPIPLFHKQFFLSARQLQQGRRSGTPIDTSQAQAATRRVAELIEDATTGRAASYSFGGGTLYGYTTFPQRLTKSMTLPTAGGWTPALLIDELLGMRQQSVNAFYYGPWKLYNSPNWDQYLDVDYSAAKGDNTLRDRILKIKGFTSMDTIDRLTGYQILLVQQTTDVVRAVIALDFTTIQWEVKGGLGWNFMVMASMVPQLRADFNGNTGLVHGVA